MIKDEYFTKLINEAADKSIAMIVTDKWFSSLSERFKGCNNCY